MQDILEQLVRPAAGRAPLLMGVLNTTPNSFFDGGKYLAASDAIAQADRLLTAGADLLDLGAESSQPQSAAVSPEEQWTRLEPVLRHVLGRAAVVSIDTTSPWVARAALALGAHVINDVSCLRDQDLARAVAEHDAWLVITHCRAPMSEMSGFSQWPDDDYTDIVEDVRREWGHARERAVQAGVAENKVIFDPGFGFSKNARQSFELLARLAEFHTLAAPILSGPSRKSFIGSVDNSPPSERLGGTLAACLLSAQAGAQMLRVHDVKEVRQAVSVWQRALKPSSATSTTTVGS